ncbi:Mss4-like protein [Aspergillus egyptiacus]|nr:Mss4-like protein [Aspergillus egyptiacus]
MPTGSCLCQAIKYQYKGEAISKAICHCQTCHKISSSFSVNLLVPHDHFRITTGRDQLKECNLTHESGMHLTTHFCGECGCTLYKTADREEFGDKVIILAGTVDGDKALEEAAPEAEFFVGERAPWMPAIGRARQLEGFT